MCGLLGKESGNNAHRVSLTLSGPFFRYQTYVDWLGQSDPQVLPCKVPCLNRLKMIPVYGLLFVIVNILFPLSYVRTDEFLERNFFFRWVFVFTLDINMFSYFILHVNQTTLLSCRFFYMVMVFFVFRMRFYAAWSGAETGCITAGLGCYPKEAESKPGGGPTVQYRLVFSVGRMHTEFALQLRMKSKSFYFITQ